MNTLAHIYKHTYICTYEYMYVYIYIYIERERGRESEQSEILRHLRANAHMN